MRKAFCAFSRLIGAAIRSDGHLDVIAFVAEHIAARHHPDAPLAVVDASIEAAPGEIVAVVGANGSGKSTFARALAGLVPIASGRAGWRGTRSGDGELRVGLVLQDPAAQAVAATVADDIAWGPERSGAAPDTTAGVVAHVLSELDLAALAARHPGELSGGQQQRVAAGALIGCAVDVLIVDEPGAMLDTAARARFAEAIRRSAANRPVIWITQRGDELAYCDRVMVLDAGHTVWSGSTRAFFAHPELAATWDVELPPHVRVAHALGFGHDAHGIDDLLATIEGRDGA